MQLSDEERHELRRLEESLWRRETRFDRAYMEGVLAPDFFEFGRSGRVYDRAETLSIGASDIDAKLPLAAFRITGLDIATVLVTYVSEVGASKEALLSNRASIWSRTDAGWRLRFHQGTPAP